MLSDCQLHQELGVLNLVFRAIDCDHALVSRCEREEGERRRQGGCEKERKRKSEEGSERERKSANERKSERIMIERSGLLQ